MIYNNKNKMINKSDYNNIHTSNLNQNEADRKWRLFEQEQAAFNMHTSPFSTMGGGRISTPPTTPPTPTILEYNTTQGPSFEWNGITFTLDTSLPNYSYTAAINAIPGTVVQVTGYTHLIGVTIGNSVTTIGSSAFYLCSNLTSVTFTPTSTLTSIAEQAFGYTGLTSIAIPTSVTSILTNAFYSSQLSTVTIANGQLGINSPDTGVSFFGATVTTVTPAPAP